MPKQHKIARLYYALLLGLLLFPVPQASIAASQDSLVTDPDLLEVMGFDKDAENIYMAAGVDLEGDFDDRFSTSAFGAKTSHLGSGTIDFAPILAKEFTGRIDQTGTQWRYQGGPNCCTDLSRLGTELFAEAQFYDLPNGGTLNGLRGWWFDSVPQTLSVFLLEVCQPGFSAGPITVTLVARLDSADGGQETQGAFINRPINVRDCAYMARVRFGAAGLNLALQKVRLTFTHP